MNIIDLFWENVQDVEMKGLITGPIVLGGQYTKHFANHFKKDADEEEWSQKAIIRLAQMVSGFPNALQFYRLGDPLREGCVWAIHEDPEVCIRRYAVPVPELWTEPGEAGLEDFVSRKKWDAHIKIVYEVVFMFER